MNDGQLDNLKQFIEATVSQTESRLTERIDGTDRRIDSIDQRLGRLEQKVDDGFAGIGEPIERHNDELADHEQRIGKLEQHAA